MKEVTLYTDGACSGNPGPGGWGAVLLYKQHRRELSGYEPHTTNNRMELTAAIQGLAALTEPCRVRLYTDSAYLAHAFEKKWIDNWVEKGWMRNKSTPVPNRDLWEQMLELTRMHQVRFILVKGHGDNVENNRCDALATGEIKKRRAGGGD